MTRIALAALAAALFLPHAADGCSCLWPDDHGFLIEESRQLPSNARGLVWVGSTPPELEHFEVVRVVDGNETAVPFVLSPLSLSRRSMRAFLVELTEPTIPGERYRFRTRLFTLSRLRDEFQEREVTVSERALYLGSARIDYELAPAETQPVTLPMGVSCSYSREAVVVRARVVLPPSIAEFREHMLFTTLLDGASEWSPVSSLCSTRIPGRSWMGAGEEQFYRLCPDTRPSPEDRLTKGEHTTAQEISFPGGGEQTTTVRRSFRIDCPADAGPAQRDP